MNEVSARDIGGAFNELLDRVEQGEEIVITRNGLPVARIVADFGVKPGEQAEAVLARMRRRAQQAGTRFDWSVLKDERDSGRP